MSHIPQRQEKDCLNCGTIVQGRYCQQCGQENVVPKESFWHMVTHFFYDITHFDSSFFRTVRHLIFKPGFLTAEYMAGRRARYLHPIRLYVFSSAMFFLLFFSIFKSETLDFNLSTPVNERQKIKFIKELQMKIEKDTNQVSRAKYRQLLAKALDTAQTITALDIANTDDDSAILTIAGKNYASQHEYDSVQASLPQGDRDGWFEQRFIKKVIDINQRYQQNPDEVGKEFASSFLHRLPYMLFISLPLFALILKLVYLRRKKFYYADHGVFTVHLYVYTFILLAVVFLFNKLQKLTGWDIWVLLVIVLFIFLFLYLLFAMKRFYGQGWLKTILKFLIVSLLSLVMMVILFVFFIFFSAYAF